MAKKKKKKGGGPDEVPIASMIDVTFLLLMYFVVTQQPTLEEAHVAMNMPSPSSAPPSDEEPPMTLDIFVTRQGLSDDAIKADVDGTQLKYYKFMGNQYTYDEVVAMVGSQAATSDDITVNIKTAVNVRHKILVKLLDACTKHNLSNLNIFALKEAFAR